MLNFNQVLQYIKGRLSLPSTFIEKTDSEMTDWIKNVTIPDFSNYYPDVEWTPVLIRNPTYQVSGRSFHYKFFDDEDIPIYDIRQCYFDLDDDYISGYPPIAALSFEGMKWWALDVFKSKFFKPFSEWNRTYRFIQPNIVRVLPEAGDNFVVEYEREQPHDLRRIPVTLKRIFMDLCLADIMIWIGGIRTHYGGGRLTTPYGEIPLEGEALKSEGQELRREIIDKITEDTIPPVIVDIG